MSPEIDPYRTKINREPTSKRISNHSFQTFSDAMDKVKKIGIKIVFIA